MQTSEEKKKIPRKYHPFTQEFGTLRSLGRLEIGLPAPLHNQKIAKCAPRVLKSYIMTRAQNIPALKRIKKITSIEDCKGSPQNQWRLVLQNKFKSVLEYFPQRHQWESLQKYKTFLNVTKVLLWDDFLRKNLLRYLPGMVNLKCLDLAISSETPPSFLKKLNSMPKMLSRLKIFRVEWNLSEVLEENLLLRFFEKSNIQKYLTHLTTRGGDEDTLLPILKQLPKYCKNLAFLSVSFLEASTDSHCSYLKLLGSFENLEGIRILAKDLGSFVNNFALPPSIKHVWINLSAFSWSDGYEELFSEDIYFFQPSLEDRLTGNKRLANFSGQWKNLKNLVSLSISAEHEKDERFFTQVFLKLILKSVPNLVNLDLEMDQLWESDENFKIDLSQNNSISLTQMFGAFQNYCDKLEKVKLSLSEKYSLACESVEGINFPKLTLLQLENNIISDVETVQNIFRIMEKPALKEPAKVFLGIIVVKSNETLLDLLETLKNSPRSMEITLTIHVKKISFDTFDTIFEEFIGKVKKAPAIRNVSLKVHIADHFDDKGLEVWSFLNEMFEKVEFADPDDPIQTYVEVSESNDEDEDSEEELSDW